MMNTFLMFVYTKKSSYTWEEMVLLLKDFWWLAVFMAVLFVYSLRGYRQHQEEQRELERQKELWGDKAEQQEPMRETIEPLEEPAARQMPSGLRWRLLSGAFAIGYLVGTDLWKGILPDGGGIAVLLFMVVLLAGMTVMRNLPSDWVYTAFGTEGKDERRVIWKNSLKEMLPYGVALLAGLVVGMLTGLM